MKACAASSHKTSRPNMDWTVVARASSRSAASRRAIHLRRLAPFGNACQISGQGQRAMLKHTFFAPCLRDLMSSFPWTVISYAEGTSKQTGLGFSLVVWKSSLISTGNPRAFTAFSNPRASRL